MEGTTASVLGAALRDWTACTRCFNRAVAARLLSAEAPSAFARATAFCDGPCFLTSCNVRRCGLGAAAGCFAATRALTRAATRSTLRWVEIVWGVRAGASLGAGAGAGAAGAGRSVGADRALPPAACCKGVCPTGPFGGGAPLIPGCGGTAGCAGTVALAPRPRRPGGRRGFPDGPTGERFAAGIERIAGTFLALPVNALTPPSANSWPTRMTLAHFSIASSATRVLASLLRPVSSIHSSAAAA